MNDHQKKRNYPQPLLPMTNFMQRGHIAIQSNNIAEAADWYAKAVAENPGDGQAKACLGQSLCWLGRRADGIDMLRMAGQHLLKKARKRKDAGEVAQLIQQLQFWDDYAGSIDLARQAIAINNKDTQCHYLLALGCSRLNQTKIALASGRQALKLEPDNAAVHILLASLEASEGQQDTARRRLEKTLQSSATPEQQFRAHKELAKILDKTGHYDQVFRHLHAAAGLSTLIPEFNKLNVAFVPSMLKAFANDCTRDMFNRWPATAFASERPAPIFLIGFLRSGTTLTQEVLGAHSEVFVADEPNLIAGLHEELNRLSGRVGSTPQQLRTLDLAGAMHLRNYYWTKVRERYGDRFDRRVLLDKTTMNTINLGLINCIFPDARVVFVMRDPRDVCLSCFMQIMSPTPSTVHLNSWEGTARFYALVTDWWMQVKQHMTLDFIEFRYEDAVTRFEPVFREIFDFVGLPWEPAVAGFHHRAAKKFISSPSFNQVAQPLYASSVGRWRHYAGEFESVTETLQPYVSAFGYDP